MIITMMLMSSHSNTHRLNSVEDVQGIGFGLFLRCQAALLVFFIRSDLFSFLPLVCSFSYGNICLGVEGVV